MTALRNAATAVLLLVGLGFFTAGAVGLLRFPDVYSRLHALTKADNLGLGFLTLALVLQAPDPWQALKIVLVWLLSMVAAATAAQMVARSALVRGEDGAPGRAGGVPPAEGGIPPAGGGTE